MCGICGIVVPDPSWQCDRDVLVAMRDAITYRGPDDAGELLEGGVALGVRRLAILDLSSRGHMPMVTPDGRFCVVYNGEVYNSAELRRELSARGYRFRSATDTEVVLYLYAEHGPAMLDRLNGMFAFAIWDRRERSLFVARDRLGIKPLYYTLEGGVLRFASEPKALFASGQTPAMDPTAWEELLCFRAVAGERTVYENVRRLLPGHWMLWQKGRIQLQRWWNLGERARALRDSSPSSANDWLAELFDDSVAFRRISDVPVGVLLSGGIDSGIVAASLALQAGKGVESFTVGFAEPGYDESASALEVANRWGLRRHELRLDGSDLVSCVAQATRLNDAPLAHGNEPHLLAISRLAKPRVTVLLSGEGADEIFGGYVRYRPLRFPSLLQAAKPWLPALSSWRGVPGRIRKLGRLLAAGSTNGVVLFNACDVFPSDLSALGISPTGRHPYRELIVDEALDVYPGDRVRQAMYVDQHTFLSSLLDRNDKMTMGASIECRVPFLDYRLVEALAALPTARLLPDGRGKPLLRDALGSRLPPALLRRRKWGFGVPWSRYLRTAPEFRAVVTGLHESGAIADGPLDARAVASVAKKFLEGDPRQELLVRQLFMIALWHRECVEPGRHRGARQGAAAL
jgi:asparagine synthase (glutamine-hydrolysing)